MAALLCGLMAGCAGGSVGGTAPTPSYIPLPTSYFPSPTPAPPIPWAPWPTAGWTSASPEQAGMDSSRLLTLMDFISQQQDLDLHSLLVIRRGYLVLDLNIYPHTSATAQEQQSVTKSFTSALVGIALQEGYLKSVDQKVLDFFPKRKIANLDSRKQAITLRDLLTMTSGLDWPESKSSYASLDNPARAMWTSPDPVQYVLDRPMAADPGSHFNYNTGASELLGAILEQTTGHKLSELASQYLFDPLGIHSFTWHRMRGIEPGGSGLVLTPRDMAKLGYLFLRGGRWEDRQLIPAGWVANSTRAQVTTNTGGGYGYQWWLNASGGFSAVGFGGQAIQVYPAQDLVVVATGAMGTAERNSLRNLIELFVLPAVVSDHPLPETSATGELLTRARAAAALPKPQPIPTLPAIAAQIAGRSYTLEANPLNWKQAKLEFPQNNEALLTVELSNGGSSRIPIGLDGVPRVAEALRTSVTGKWENEQTFTLQYEILGGSDGDIIQMAFNGSQVDLTLTSYVQADVTHVKAKAP